MYNFFAVWVFLSLIFSAFSSYATNEYDGLAFFVGRTGYGLGFVVNGNKLVAPAYSLEHTIERWYVVQNGQLVNVSDLVQSPYTIHPDYIKLSSNHSPLSILRRRADVGVVTLARLLKSNFDIAPFRTFSEFDSTTETSDVYHDLHVVAVDTKNSQMIGDFNSSERVLATTFNELKLPNDVTPFAIKFDVSRGKIHLDGKDNIESNVFVEDGDLENTKRDDGTSLFDGHTTGMPLYAVTPEGRFSVIGMNVGTFAIPDYPHASGPYQTIFVNFVGIQATLAQASSRPRTPPPRRSSSLHCQQIIKTLH